MSDLRFVKVPRAVADRYYHQPWAEVVAAAERGSDGLSVQAATPRSWTGSQQGQPMNHAGEPDPDVCFLAEGWSGGVRLYQQNWCR